MFVCKSWEISAAKMAHSQLAMAVKRRETPSIPSIPIQSLHMDPKYNVLTCCRKFSGIQRHWGHVRLQKLGKLCGQSKWPNSQLAMDVKRRERPSIPSIPIQSLHMDHKYNVLTCCRKFSGILKYWGHVRLQKLGNLWPKWPN